MDLLTEKVAKIENNERKDSNCTLGIERTLAPSSGLQKSDSKHKNWQNYKSMQASKLKNTSETDEKIRVMIPKVNHSNFQNYIPFVWFLRPVGRNIGPVTVSKMAKNAYKSMRKTAFSV